MSSLNPFKKPKIKAPEIAKKDNTKDIAAAQARELERAKTQRGRAATLLTSGRGVTGDDTTGAATKMLLGG